MRLAQLVSVSVAVTCLVVAELAYACVCMAPPTVEEAFAKSSAVFRGRVTKIYHPLLERMGITKTGGYRVKFEITKQWKGFTSRTAVVTTRLTGEACGYPFRKGREYLVYVVDEPADIQTGICRGTKEIDNAEDEMLQLDRLLKNTPQHLR